MSELSQVPIEPPEQTRLLDACMNVEGVAMAGVPGGKGEIGSLFPLKLFYLTSYYPDSWWL